jgi:dihydrofolate reductase
MSDIRLSSIVAIARNHVIGKNNTLIWHLPADLKHFKTTTMGKPIIMGRKSYDSLGKPLPGRPNIVISRSSATLINQPTSHFSAMESVAQGSEAKVNEGPFLYPSIEEAIGAAKSMAREMGLDEVFITGGGEIYKQTLPLTQRLYLTVLERDYEGDTHFPEFDWSEWSISEQTSHPADPEKDRPAFTIYTLDRR